MTNSHTTPTSTPVHNLPALIHNDVPVITTELLAQAFETESKNLRMNFANNQSKFTEGKHYFKLVGQELKYFKHRAKEIGSVEISPRIRALTLYTKRGSFRHAKMLGTDRAWDIQDELEEHYFDRHPRATPTQQPARNTIHLDETRKVSMADAVRFLENMNEMFFSPDQGRQS